MIWNPASSSQRGFSLVELALVVSIIGFLVSTIASVGSMQIQQQRVRDTQMRLEFIATAIEQYVLEYNHLPCPADPTLAYGQNNVGVSQRISDTYAAGADVNNCRNVTKFQPTATGANIAIGTVPYVSLGIASAAAEDGWGNKIMYVVDQDLTVTGTKWDTSPSNRPGFLNNGPADVNNVPDFTLSTPAATPPSFDIRNYEGAGTVGSIHILNQGGTDITYITSPYRHNNTPTTDTTTPPVPAQLNALNPSPLANGAAYVLISYGPNGSGAYPARGGGRRALPAAGTPEEENTNNDATFRIQQPTRNFDDMVFYKPKWQINNVPW